MSKTSQKHRNFVVEPMGEKPVTDVAGIGAVYGATLAREGFDKAYTLLGQFLLFKKNGMLFKCWLTDLIGCNEKNAEDCFRCLDEWCKEFI